jgi:hypothetical protein
MGGESSKHGGHRKQYRVLVATETARCNGEDSIKTDRKETGRTWNGLIWLRIETGLGGLVSMVMYLQVP